MPDRNRDADHPPEPCQPIAFPRPMTGRRCDAGRRGSRSRSASICCCSSRCSGSASSRRSPRRRRGTLVVDLLPESRSAAAISSSSNKPVERRRPKAAPGAQAAADHPSGQADDRAAAAPQPWIEMTKDEMAAADVRNMPKAGAGRRPGDSEVVGQGPARRNALRRRMGARADRCRARRLSAAQRARRLGPDRLQDHCRTTASRIASSSARTRPDRTSPARCARRRGSSGCARRARTGGRWSANGCGSGSTTSHRTGRASVRRPARPPERRGRACRATRSPSGVKPRLTELMQ